MVSIEPDWESHDASDEASYGRSLFNFHRTYDPTTGRYLEADPIGPAGGLNLYEYAISNPLTFADPEGTTVLVGTGLAGASGSAGAAGASGVGTAVTAGALGGLAVGAAGVIGYGIGTLIEPYVRPHIERALSSISDDAVSTPTDAAPPEECERPDCERSFATDVAVCRAIGIRSRKRAALCYESAINRKGACEKGLPPSDWPPLITWNN